MENKSVVFTFGRMNPFTKGHLKVVEKIVNEIADSHKLYLSHKQDKPKRKNPLDCKNPLPYELKKVFVNQFLRDNGFDLQVEESDARTIFDALVELYQQGFKQVKIVVGSDRVAEFEILVNKYNGGIDPDTGEIGYKFDTIEVISAGDRDPDSEDLITSMSASKLRKLAYEGNFEEFVKGVPTTDNFIATDLYNDLRKYMGL